MPVPSGTLLRTITGTRVDEANKPHKGTILFTLLTDVPAVSGVVLTPVRLKLTATGTFSIDVLVPTDHQAYPDGWVYQMDEWYEGGLYRRSKYALTDSLASSTDIDTLTPVAMPVTHGKYATKAELDDLLTRMHLTFSQFVADDVWTINHNFGYYPNVTVFDELNDEVEPDKAYPSLNQVVLTFGRSTAGRALLS